MSISLPTGDQNIDNLLAELTNLINTHGADHFLVSIFIDEHSNDSWTDRRTGDFHYFSEIAPALCDLIQGIENKEEADDDDDSDGDDGDEGDAWKSGETC